MTNAALVAPQLLTDAGFLYWAPVGSTLPSCTVVGGVFTDTWPVAWVSPGMTEGGTDIDLTTTVSPILAAEQIDPLAYRTTDRTGTITFELKSFVAANLARALNGAVTTVTGATTTTLTQIDPPAIGTEVRVMIGYESLDCTFRFVAFQTINAVDIKMTMTKAPKNTNIPCKFNFEKPATTQPWRAWTAGTARA
jgi:hypothetical protein